MSPELAQANYIAKLRAHDWSFEYSDSHSVWQRGRASLGELQALQCRLDSDFAIWNNYAPEGFKREPGKTSLTYRK